MTLQIFLLAILSGSVAIGPTVFYLFNKIPKLRKIAPDKKRLAVAFAAGVIGISLWAFAAYLGYVPFTFDKQSIAESIWQYGILSGLSAFTSSQVIHGVSNGTK